MTRTVKIINTAVLCIWVALIVFLLYRNYAGTALETSEIVKKSFEKITHWYDIYREKEKIGVASTSFEKAGTEIIINHKREIEVQNEKGKQILVQNLRCLSDPYYFVKSFEYSSKYGHEKRETIRGEVDDESIFFFFESPETRKTFKVPTKGRNIYLPVTFIPHILRQQPRPNTTFLIPMLNPVKPSIDTVQVVLEEIRPLKVGINISSLFKFRAGNLILWSNEKGVIVKEQLPSGVTLYEQVERIAEEARNRILIDYTSLPFFKSDTLIPNREEIRLSKIKIKGFRLDSRLYEQSSTVLNKNVITVHRATVEELKENTYTLPYEDNRMEEYLSPDKWVRSDYGTLQYTGRVFAKSRGNDAYALSEYLNGYLYTLVRTKPMFVLSDAESILKSLTGDYLERTVMFASYARAAGLPTRLIGGLLYNDGFFYFHTWPEVWFDKWVPIDPTFVQFPADALHIPLVEGTLEEIVSVIDDMKNIKMEILEVS